MTSCGHSGSGWLPAIAVARGETRYRSRRHSHVVHSCPFEPHPGGCSLLVSLRCFPALR
jgi:hypothetical protein